MRKLSEETYISLGLFVILAGAIVWFTTLYSKTEANASALSELQAEYKKMSRKLNRIDKAILALELDAGLKPVKEEGHE